MIVKEKYDQAIYALHLILVRARYMVLTSEPLNDIALLLDYAEMLPRFIASGEDQTNEFRSYLLELAEKFPSCRHILGKFDELSVPDKW